jgi:hypothetical protein
VQNKADFIDSFRPPKISYPSRNAPHAPNIEPDQDWPLDKIEDNGMRVVIVEDASRFARELVTQELGIIALIKRGVRVLTRRRR